jgi:hypothetical protein
MLMAAGLRASAPHQGRRQAGAAVMIWPDGQNTQKPVNPLLQKYSDLQKIQSGSIFLPILSHQEGRYAIVTFAGRAAVDAKGA